jgi:hypothetical protein
MYNRYVFGGCALIGFLIGRLLGSGAVAAYTSLMIAYHLYLVFLIYRKERESGMKLAFVGRTFLIHLGCLVPLICLAVVRQYIPVFVFVRLLTLVLAFAEAKWLFKGQVEESAKQTARVLEAITGSVAPAAPVAQASAPAAAVVTSVAAFAPIAVTPAPSSFAVVAPETSVPVANIFAETAVSARESVPTVPVPAAPAITAPVMAAQVAAIPVATYSITPSAAECVPITSHPVAATAVTSSESSVPLATYSFTACAVAEPAPVIAPHSPDAGEDPYDEFVKHMQQGKRPFRKPGISVKEEFDLWLAARAKSISKPAPQRAGMSRFLQTSRSVE